MTANELFEIIAEHFEIIAKQIRSFKWQKESN